MSHSPRRVLVIGIDLFFITRIAATADRTGVDLVVAKPEEALERCKAVRPELVIVDLEAGAGLPDLIRALRREPAAARVPMVGFYPHVRQSLQKAAVEAGLDRAMPRSAFSARLAEILLGEA